MSLINLVGDCVPHVMEMAWVIILCISYRTV